MIKKLVQLFINQSNSHIRNIRYIDNIKDTGSMHILSLNLRGLSLENDHKMQILIDTCYKLDIDIFSSNKSNTK